MAHFQASLTNSSTLQPAITLDETTGIITFVDESNYTTNTDDGHAQANFTIFRRFIVTDFNNVTTVYDAQGNGDVLIDPASVGGNDSHTYLTVGDGVYTIRIITVPTYGAGETYIIDDEVYYSGSFYKSKQNSNTGNTPNSSAAYWELVGTDPLSLLSKYNTFVKFCVTTELIACCIEAINAAVDTSYKSLNPCDNPKMMVATELDLILSAININGQAGKWDEVADLITKGKGLCDC